VAKRNATKKRAQAGRAAGSRRPAAGGARKASARGTARRTAAPKGGARKTAAGKRAAETSAARKSAARKSAVRKKSVAGKAAAPGKTTTARRKTAARAAASKSTRRSPGARRAAPSSQAASAAGGNVRGTVAAALQLVAGSMPWSADENDPIALLERDHRRFEDLLREGEETTERALKGRTALLDTLTAALNLHELIEEKVLYPALKPHAETRAIVLEGFEEHHVADVIVKELHDLATDNERWGAKFKVLQESLEHHIQEEERNMFPNARQVLSREELQALGARMRAMKAEAERG
jgi:hemerythrin-like domain-containing protein